MGKITKLTRSSSTEDIVNKINELIDKVNAVDKTPSVSPYDLTQVAKHLPRRKVKKF